MKVQAGSIDANLNRVEFRWKWRRLLRRSLVLGTVVSASVLALGVAMVAGWLANKRLAEVLFVSVAALALLTWGVLFIGSLAGSADRRWLAGLIERADSRLLDRLNTLVFLEGRYPKAYDEAFSARIEQQTNEILAAKPVRVSFSGRHSIGPRFVVFVVTLAATISFYERWGPWQAMLSAQSFGAESLASQRKLPDFALPPTNSVEQSQSWGEVRITDPAGDLRVTKVDVVPLQIEAAANQPLQNVKWFSTVNGAAETPHELPRPAEPRFAVYHPDLYLDEFHLSDWDVMTYYAKANTEPQGSFASDVYFLEVRPFWEEILKLPGGEGGKGYQCLSEISGLIAGQQHVIRQTHQYQQHPPDSPPLQAQDRKKLSEGETDLGDSTRHLYASMAAEMENAPIGEALDNLAKAGTTLDQAGRLLAQNSMDGAQNHERTALTELVAARKMFQKALTEHPDAFGEPRDEPGDPVVDATKKLNQMAEFRDEAKAAQAFVQKTLEQQRALEKEARKGPGIDSKQLAGKEGELGQELANFMQQHPQPFKGSEGQAQQAQQAMHDAENALETKNPQSRVAVQSATRAVSNMNDTLKDQTAQNQLADAYRLKQMLDKSIRTLEQRARPDSGISEADTEQTATAARETVGQLRKLAEEEPTRDAFGQGLRDALSGKNKVDLDAKLMRLERPRRLDQVADGEPREQRVRDARDALARVSKAFEQSLPGPLQFARQSDLLKPNGQDSFAEGMAEMESLLKQLQNQRPISPEDRAAQGRQALSALQTGMRSRYGDNERGNQILVHLDEMLKAEHPLEVADLKKFMDELEHFSVETSDQLAKAEAKPDVVNIDPERLPPAYRGRIQKYFQKLSEK